MRALFIRPDGHRDFTKGLKSAFVPGIRFHDLRPTAASLMLNYGAPALVVSRILGHANASVTLTLHSHSELDLRTQAARVIDGIVTPTPVRITRAEKVLAK